MFEATRTSRDSTSCAWSTPVWHLHTLNLFAATALHFISSFFFFLVLWRKLDLFCLIFTPSVKKTKKPIIAALSINQYQIKMFINDYQERSKPLSKTRKDIKRTISVCSCHWSLISAITNAHEQSNNCSLQLLQAFWTLNNYQAAP